MRNIFRLSVAVMLMLPMAASAQQKSDPEGYLTYSLPSTTIVLDVEAVQESFYAGPYAKYAEKYLGIKVRQKDMDEVQLTHISMTPCVEADQNCRYTVNVEKGYIQGDFLRLSEGGLVSFSDAGCGEIMEWRFPSAESASSYIDSKRKDLVMPGVQVGKSQEQRASETAAAILKLREQRLQIVTGDTDATYSGEAMGAAIAELTRLEEEYMLLFTGYSEFRTQKLRFEVIPVQNQENQTYVAFRISDTDGIVPADNLSGTPVIMHIIPQEFAQTHSQVEQPKDKKGNEIPDKAKKEVLAHYRIPAMCTVKLMDGVDLLLQGRIPVYQLGQESSLPMNVKLK